MFRRGFKRALKWVCKNSGYCRSNKQSDRRVVAAAVRMTRELALTNPRLAGIHATSDRPARVDRHADPDVMAENNAEVDRVCVQHSGRQLAQTRHHKKVVFFRAEGRC